MPAYPTADSDLLVSLDELEQTVARVFRACGMSAEDSGLLADTLVSADATGVHSHGVLRVPEYVRKLRGGGVDPNGRPRLVVDNEAALVVDGGNAMGQVAGVFAMRQAIERARRTQVALAAVRGSNHCGAMAYYVKLAVAEGMIGIAATNALPTMAPWGGLDKIVGINPLGVGIPAGEEPPIVYDAAFAGSSHGKLRVYQQKGLDIPPNWAFDQDGNVTTDAAAAVQGLLQPIGEYKGVGLAMIMGILSSMLSGAAYGPELGDMVNGPRPGLDGHFFLAIRIAAFLDPSEFKARVDHAVRELRGSRRAAGVERLYAPGELEAETEKRARKQGVRLSRETLNGVASTARDLGVEATVGLDL
jgi:LDH2 family malate/lactate/ureidoglycolate dehydrogenase